MPENLILQLMPETIKKGYLHRLIEARRQLEDAIESIMAAESDGDMKAAGELIDLPLDELENIQIDALRIAAQSREDAENERLRSTGGKG
jgi:uncharacterized protein YdeI (YjbR/CyaY-like superfamily)